MFIEYLSIHYPGSAGYILGNVRYIYTLLSFLGIEIKLVVEIIFPKNTNTFLSHI